MLNEECPHCHGSGADSPSDVETCSRCHGQGSINVDQRTMFGTMRTQQACPSCGGAGKTVKKRCQTCNGQGRIKEKKQWMLKFLPVLIPTCL
jgi:molecular chaperone DnaJ